MCALNAEARAAPNAGFRGEIRLEFAPAMVPKSKVHGERGIGRERGRGGIGRERHRERGA